MIHRKKIGHNHSAIMRLGLIIVTLLMSVPAFSATTFESGQFKFTIISVSPNKCKVDGLASGITASGNLNIPESVKYNGNTYTVTGIASSAFFGCSGFTGTLTIPESITYIDNYVFCDCTGLTGPLTIPESVTSIGVRAFSSCI